MQRGEITHAIEAIVFAAAEPVGLGELKKIFTRLFVGEDEERRAALLSDVKESFAELAARAGDPDDASGFVLTRVAEGLTYRSNPRYAFVLRAMREEKPQRLSQAALETLAIVAYRQPVTKPEVDDIRGVDSGGTLRALLDRSLVRIIGKKDEPGRPLLYGTTKEFLSFFNLANLTGLPTLREFHELSPDSHEELESFDEQQPSLRDLSHQATKLRLGEEPAIAVLDEALAQLAVTDSATKDVFRAQGISFGEEPASATATPAAEATATGEDSGETP